MNVDPKYLIQLSSIIERESFHAAADYLGISQPALSRNMKLLEERLGAQLFRKDGRRSAPTRLAIDLSQEGLSIRQATERAQARSRLSSAVLGGELTIGAPPIVAGKYLSTVLADLVQTHPNCRIELRTGLVSELLAKLERGQVDVVVGPRNLEETSGELEFTPFLDDSVGILCRADHALMSLPKISVGDLEALRWVAHSKGSLLRRQTNEAMLAVGISSLNIFFETDSISAALEIVRATDLVTTMPRTTSSGYLEDSLDFVKFDHPLFHRPLGIIRRKNSSPTPLEQKFSTLLVNKRVPDLSFG